MTKPFTEFDVYRKSVTLAKEIFRFMETKNLEKEYGF